ncbi:MAG: hypothetical protein JW801_17035 [Bacteroidales bacterium]|nr:hypothetical protein [Bacteroidales bacterium]
MQVIYKIRILVVIMALIGFLIILSVALTAWKDLHQTNQRMKGALKNHRVLDYVSLPLDADTLLTTCKKNFSGENISIIL